MPIHTTTLPPSPAPLPPDWPQPENHPFRDLHRAPGIPTQATGEDLLYAFAHASPAWVDALMGLRNAVVRPLGLKTGPMPEPVTRPIRLGQQLGIFRVLHLAPKLALIGEDDQHLNFRIFLWLDADGTLNVSTWVQPHNTMGRLYLALVTPFHHLISRVMVARVAQRVRQQLG